MSTTTIDNTEIKYDRITKDYAILVDGVAVAYGRNYSEAEAKRTAYLAERDTATATELDGGSCCSTCGNDGDCPDCNAITTSIITTIVHQAMQATPTCKNCNAPHHTWQCPEIGNLLFAEPVVMVMNVEYAPAGWAA